MDDGRAASTLRGLDSGDHQVFSLHFEWTGPLRTSLYKHRGWELVLVRDGRLLSICDGRRGATEPGGFLELLAGSAHAIWSEGPCTFEVMGQADLGLWMVVPDRDGSLRDVPIYDLEGPWRMQPPAGTPLTLPEEVARLRQLSQKLF
jgi:hypothetical protein